MKTCSNCNIEITNDVKYCKNCNFPILGNEKEKASFFAQQVIQKGKVIKAKKKMKVLRIIIFMLSVFFIFPSLVNLSIFGTNTILLRFFIGILFLGLGLYSYEKQKVSFLLLFLISILFYFDILYIHNFRITFESSFQLFITLIISFAFFITLKTDKLFNKNKYIITTIEEENKRKS